MDAQKIIARAEEISLARYLTELKDTSPWQLHSAIASSVMMEIGSRWTQDQKQQRSNRIACYLSCEYLIGRMVYNNLFSLGILDECRELLKQKGVDITLMEDVEDAALGNGGLGRLAACFLDSAASHDVPLFGYGLRYRYGLFKQEFVNNRQYEMPDDWTRFGDPWSIRRNDRAVLVEMEGLTVRAVPYDMPVIGYQMKRIGTLRLWQCESVNPIDFELFNQQHYAQAAQGKNAAEDITKLLYPNDTEPAGKQLRARQQYVLCSATLQDLMRDFRQYHGTDYSKFPEFHSLQLNDTHPTMAIPELIRLLMAEGITFENAFDIARKTFAYTNHTVMQEALEKWDIGMLESVSKEIADIIRRLAQRQNEELDRMGVWNRNGLCLLQDNRVHMAYLAMYGSYAVNGVARIHSEILKNDVLKDWYAIRPEMFQNKTNGITQRRWLGLCNPELSKLIESKIGNGFLTDLYELSNLKPMIAQDDQLVRDFIAIKKEKKAQLSRYIEKQEGVTLPPEFVFDVQVKRMHEYKRQLLNAFSILDIYFDLKEGKLSDMPPVAMIFGAKAAPGYIRAKGVIRFINQIAKIVNNDPETNQKLRVVFVHNYNCSYAEEIIPAADISEQISPAGTEASGTGNMKLMLNGAVTLGTYDGANIEIVEQAGEENNYIFGARLDEINAIKHNYYPRGIYEENYRIKRVMDTMLSGFFPDEDGALKEIYHALLDGASWHAPDHYFLLKDFPSYRETKLRAIYDTKDQMAFARKALYNVAGAGKFSSDRTIAEYAKEIWHV
ncbi:MAG: glycogen/starch/alpha-glucan family phosphorylase [Clostridia bacterium]|nr:glycogen/starch/alpha-glucan family phosphorylase [Clostridia bacterium]